MERFRDNYGAGPLHLLSSVAMGAIVLYALTQIASDPKPLSFAIWFGGAVIAHDMLGFPLYSALGLVAGRATAKAAPNSINYIRVPAFFSAMAFVAFFPFILGLSGDLFELKTGVAVSGYLERWLLLTAALALGSALLFAINTRRGGAVGATEAVGRRDRAGEPAGEGSTGSVGHDGPVTSERADAAD